MVIEQMYYETNLSRLRNYYPQLAERVETHKERDALYLLKTPNGSYTIKLSDDKGRELYLHSKYNPLSETAYYIKRVDISTPKTWFMVGLGLGYVLFKLMETMCEKSNVVVIERRMDFFKSSLTLFDWSSILQSGRVKFIIEEGLEESEKKIGEYFPKDFSRKTEILEHTPSIKLYPQYYPLVIKKTQSLIEKRRANLQKIRSIIEEDYERTDRPPNLDLHSHTKDRKSYSQFYEEQGRRVKICTNTDDRILDILDCAEGDCLDIGCQGGSFTIRLAKEGHRSFGVDISRSYIEQAVSLLKEESKEVQGRVILIQGWAEGLPFKDERFQTVLLGEILEHVIEPRKVLGEALRVLSQGGILYVSVPATILCVADPADIDSIEDNLEHVRIFTEKTLIDLSKEFDGVLDLSTLRWYAKTPLVGNYRLTIRKCKKC